MNPPSPPISSIKGVYFSFKNKKTREWYTENALYFFICGLTATMGFLSDVEFRPWMCDYIPLFYVNVVTYSCYNLNVGFVTWWRHQMETFAALLALCAGNSPVTGEFLAQGPVSWSFDVFIICAWINDWVNNREAGHFRCHRAHYDVIVMNMLHQKRPQNNITLGYHSLSFDEIACKYIKSCPCQRVRFYWLEHFPRCTLHRYLAVTYAFPWEVQYRRHLRESCKTIRFIWCHSTHRKYA